MNLDLWINNPRGENTPYNRRDSLTLTLLIFFNKGECPMLESKFKTKLVKELNERFPGCMVIHTDANEIQGIPDLLILYNNNWAALEGKKYKKASRRPNQEYYVNLMNEMSFARFIYPENKEEILDELQRAFTIGRSTRLSKSK